MPPQPRLHRFEREGRRYALDVESCFCFECDPISWDVLEHYPEASVNRIHHLLDEQHLAKELDEVVGELEWLRATKAILQPPKMEEQQRLFEVERGLKQLDVFLSRRGAPTPQKDFTYEVVSFLLSRSLNQQELQLEFNEDEYLRNAPGVVELITHAFRAAQLAGKKLTVALRLNNPRWLKQPAALETHSLSPVLQLSAEEFDATLLQPLTGSKGMSLADLLKAYPQGSGAALKVVLTPADANFVDAYRALQEAGSLHIEIDLAAALVETPTLSPAALYQSLAACALHYANQLLRNNYYRLDPIAPIFWRIYQGQPLRRADPSGVNSLAVDVDGSIYPSRHWVGNLALRAGSLESVVEEAALRCYEDAGSLTTAPCLRCWARNLCGGGNIAVHQALTGNWRQPHPDWSEAQRAWLESAIAAFSLLSSAGVNFSRLYSGFGKTTEKLSLFTLAKAALQTPIMLRPIEEADAELLASWENWSGSAYFLYSESGMFMATRYDREMDSLHPRPFEQEFVLTKKGTPMGLLKIQPVPALNAARLSIYFRNPLEYASGSVRRGFKFLLKEAAARQAMTRLIVPVGPKDDGLAAFLEAVGFTQTGSQRQALFLHGEYHEVQIYALTLA